MLSGTSKIQSTIAAKAHAQALLAVRRVVDRPNHGTITSQSLGLQTLVGGDRLLYEMDRNYSAANEGQL